MAKDKQPTPQNTALREDGTHRDGSDDQGQAAAERGSVARVQAQKGPTRLVNHPEHGTYDPATHDTILPGEPVAPEGDGKAEDKPEAPATIKQRDFHDE